MAQTRARSSGIIIANGNRDKLILQRKSITHPIITCREKLALFGGGAIGDEHHAEVMRRELREEIVPKIIGTKIARFMSYNGVILLPGNQYAGSYELDLFISFFGNETFDAVASIMTRPENIREGSAEVLERSKLEQLFADTNEFVGSHDVPLKNFFERFGY